jgi:hypothetical protein
MSKIKVGKPQARTDVSAHVRGVREGNSSARHHEEPGLTVDGTSTARRSTGISAEARNPILPSMPNLSPA